MAQAEVLPIEITAKNSAQGAFAQLRGDLNGIKSSLGGVNQSLSSTLNLFTGGASALTAALGIGAVGKALSLVSEASHNLAQKSQELRSFSEATGLTVTQVQALTSEASKFGLTTEEVQSAVQQFTARFNELRLGQGELLTQIRRINPALADQMALATDSATAMTLFGRALQQTDNIFEKNALMKAATGRGGLRAANLFSGIDVNSLTQTYVDAGRALDDNLIKKLAQLEIDIAKTSAKARQNLTMIFAGEVLTAEKAFADKFLEFSQAAKDFTLSPDFDKFYDAARFFLNIKGSIFGQSFETMPARPKLPEMDPFGTFAAGGAYPKPGAAPDPQYVANQLRAQIAALGDAATFTQKLSLAQQDLAIKGKEAGLSERQLAVAAGALNLSFDLQRLQARLGLLGELATADEAERAAQDRINQSILAGNKYTDEQIARMKEKARLQQQYSQLPNQLQFERDQIGRNDTDSAVASRLRAANLPIDLQSATAQQIRFNEELKVGKDAATDFFGGFAKDLAHGVTAMDALTSAVGRLRDRFIDMAINNIASKAIGGLGNAAEGGSLSKIFSGFTLPGFASGFDGMVGGSGGTDSQLVAFMGTPGERVTVGDKGQNSSSSGGITYAPTYHFSGDIKPSDRAWVMSLVAQSEQRVRGDVTGIVRGTLKNDRDALNR